MKNAWKVILGAGAIGGLLYFFLRQKKPKVSPALLASIGDILKAHNKNGVAAITAALLISKLPAGSVQETDYLKKLAQNIADVAAGSPKMYPDITFGAYGV